MTLNKFNLPDVGEGLTEAEIVAWKVKAGDTVAINDVLCEIETAKSLVELPSPFAGTVTELLVPEGVTVEVGTPIISVSDAVTAPAAAGGACPGCGRRSSRRRSSGCPGAHVRHAAGRHVRRRRTCRPSGRRPACGVRPQGRRRQAPAADFGIVGQPGPRSHGSAAVPLRPRPALSGRGSRPTTSGSTRPPSADRLHAPAVADDLRPTIGGAISGLVGKVLAKPPVRKIARDLGINLADVVPTGARGEVTREDLVSYQAQRDAEVDQADSFWGKSGRPQDQRIERIPVKGVRKATAKAMVESAFAAPHVSIFVDVDASRTMEFVKRLKASRDFEGIKVSPLLILAKAVIWAAARNPSVNATWVDNPDGSDSAEIHVKHFMNLGIAAATPRGLMVPNIKNAQDLSLKQLALSLNELATTARAGKTQPAQMRGGTLTVTNIGALGIDTGTPIINPGEVAIVAFGTIKQKPWVLDGEVIPRWITTLGGSFDHRVVDGDLSARFMADVAAILEEPALLLD